MHVDRNMYLPFHFYGFEFVGHRKHVSTWTMSTSNWGTVKPIKLWCAVIFNYKRSWKLYECNLFRMDSTTLNGFVHESLAQGHFWPNTDHHHHTSRVGCSLSFSSFVLCCRHCIFTAFGHIHLTCIFSVGSHLPALPSIMLIYTIILRDGVQSWKRKWK